MISCTMPEIDNKWYKLDCVPFGLTSDNTGYDVIEKRIANIHYNLYFNGFQPVQKTLDEKTANCANAALLDIAIWYKISGEKGSLIYCLSGGGLHYCARIDGKIWEIDIIEIYEVIEFDNIANYIYWRQ